MNTDRDTWASANYSRTAVLYNVLFFVVFVSACFLGLIHEGSLFILYIIGLVLCQCMAYLKLILDTLKTLEKVLNSHNRPPSKDTDRSETDVHGNPFGT